VIATLLRIGVKVTVATTTTMRMKIIQMILLRRRRRLLLPLLRFFVLTRPTVKVPVTMTIMTVSVVKESKRPQNRLWPTMFMSKVQIQPLQNVRRDLRRQRGRRQSRWI
jgi:hypothetical protein